MNNDSRLLAEAYEMLLEAKKKLSPGQRKIAAQAPPQDEITGADFKALKGKKKHLKEDAGSPDAGSTLNVQPGDWGDSYQEVKGLIDQLISYGIDKSVLSGVLQYAEEVGYTGESVDNLIKLIQHFNGRGVQDS